MNKSLVLGLSVGTLIGIAIASVAFYVFTASGVLGIKKGIVSISMANLVPAENTQTCSKYSIYLRGSGTFTSSLEVPNGAIIRNFTVTVHDDVPNGHVAVGIIGVNQTNGNSVWALANVSTTDPEVSPYDIVLHDDVLHNAQIDYKNCVYHVYATLSFDSESLYVHSDTKIEYEQAQ